MNAQIEGLKSQIAVQGATVEALGSALNGASVWGYALALANYQEARASLWSLQNDLQVLETEQAIASQFKPMRAGLTRKEFGKPALV